MLQICIPVSDLANLNSSAGVPVRINGQPQQIRREDDYLIYGPNRCKILREAQVVDGRGENCISFSCASHGMEDDRHTLIEW